MSRRSIRRTREPKRVAAVSEPLESRIMLYQTYPGDPRWQFGDRNLTFSYTNALDGGLAGINATQIQNSVNEALSLWSAVIPWTFTRVIDPDPNFVTDETYSATGWPIIRIGQHNIDGPRNTIGHGFRPGSNGINGDFHFDISEQWTANPTPGTWPPYDPLETVLHEMGHVLGLDHEGVNTAIMNGNYAGRFTGSGTGFLFQDDINGVQSLYGAGLGYALDTDGTMYVSGTSGINTISVGYSGGNITVNSAGFGSFTRTASGITKLVIRAGNGNDAIIVNQVPFPVQVDGGGGTNDTLQMIAADTNNNFNLQANNQISGHSVSSYTGIESTEVTGGSQSDSFTVLAAPTIPVTLNGRFGNDTFQINAMSNLLTLEGDFGNDTFNIFSTGSASSATIRGGFDNDTFNFQEINIATTVDAGAGNDTFVVGTNAAFRAVRGALTLNGDAGDDTASLAPNAPASVSVVDAPVTFNGGANQDTLYLAAGWLDAVTGAITFNGGGFSASPGDRAFLYDDSVSAPYDYNLTSTTLTRNPFFGGLTYSALSSITLECTQGNNQVTVGNSIGPTLALHGNNGDDNFVVGAGHVSAQPAFGLDGGSGNDRITFDDHLSTINTIWDMLPGHLFFGGILNMSTAGFESVGVLAGLGGDSIFFYADTYAQSFVVNAGGGNDLIDVAGSIVGSLELSGGAGNFDVLDLDDRGFGVGAKGFATVYADRIVRLYAPTPQMDLRYDDIEQVPWHLPPREHIVDVLSLSPELTSEFQIIGNSQADAIVVWPTPATPNINGELIIEGGGGADQVLVIADGGPTGGTFTLSNPFSPSLAVLSGTGIGAGLVGVFGDVETLDIRGSGGNDTFVVEQFKSGSALLIQGRGGNDTCTIGNGNMQANLTNAAAFTFNGGANNDRFTINNGLTTLAWTYGFNVGVVGASIVGVYSWTSTVQEIESQYVFAGSSNDSFGFGALPAGIYTECNGFGGYDALSLGFGFSGIQLDSILSPVVFNAGANGGAVFIDDSADTTGDVGHLTASTLGAFAGDTMFGPGGSLTFSDLSNSGTFNGMNITCGSGADTIYAQPLVSSRVTINASDPSGAPGDSLRLATAALSSPSINGTPASGNLTSANRQMLDWTGFEGSITTDAIAPAVLQANINVNGVPGFADSGMKQSVDVRFSENVSGLLSAASLLLTNLTTNQTIPAANMAVSYETGTNTAHFTFPGYPNGILPDGDYSGKILAGLPDFFGNGLPADAPFTFFFLQGDANHDRRVNVSDFTILAGNFGQSNRNFSQGDFNYDNIVNVSDFTILASRFGTALAADGSIQRTGERMPLASAPFGTSRIGDTQSEEDRLIGMV